MTERRFVPFNPLEPHPALPPAIDTGTRVALYDQTMRRRTEWFALEPACGDGCDCGRMCALVYVGEAFDALAAVLWDGTRDAVTPLGTPLAVRPGQLVPLTYTGVREQVSE